MSDRTGGAAVDQLVLAAAGAIGSTVVSVWAGAALAAAVTHRSRLQVSVADVTTALTRMPSRWTDPAKAWPAEAQPLLPGPVPYWICTLLATAVAAVILVLVVRWARHMSWGMERRRRFGVDTQSRLAGPRDLAPLIVSGPVPGRFMLGRVGRHLVATESRTAPVSRRRGDRARRGDRGAVALIGPTRCGKTNAAISGILEWDGPAVLSSVKTDLMAATAAWRRQLGDVKVFDPTGSTNEAGSCWSPLRAADSTLGAQRAARALVDAAPREGVEGGADFWMNQAEILLSGLLWLAAISPGRTMRDVASWVFTQDRPREDNDGDVYPLLQKALDDPHLDEEGAVACEAVMAVWHQDDRTRASVYATAQTVVWPWQDPGVAESSRRNDIDLNWLSGGTNTVYLCAPIEDQARLAPAFGGLLADLIKQVALHVSRTGQPLDPPLLVVIDEAGNTPLRSLPEYASIVAGLGIQLVTIWQSRAQLEAAYGKRTDVVLTNHLTKVFFAGASDLGGLDLVSRLLGQEQVTTRQLSTDDTSGRRSMNHSDTETALAPVHLIRQMRPGDAVLIHGTLPPAHLRTRPYFKDRRLHARSRAIPAWEDNAPTQLGVYAGGGASPTPDSEWSAAAPMPRSHSHPPSRDPRSVDRTEDCSDQPTDLGRTSKNAAARWA